MYLPDRIRIECDNEGRDAHGNPRRAADDGAEEILPALGRALLRVVEEAERPDAMVAQRAVVEQDARHDQRPGERAAPRLVRAGDETCAEASIEAQELLAGPLLHGADLTASAGRRGST